MFRRAAVVAGAAAAIAVAVAGCSSSGGSDNGGTAASPGGGTTSSTMPAGNNGGQMSDKQFGAACAMVPKSGAGSFNGMASDPVATAASNNPVLSTLVAAVKAAGLVDTLNSQKAITVFAPANTAFAKIPKATLKSVLNNKKELTSILTYHVLAGKIAPGQLAGMHKTLEGAMVDVKGSGTNFTVGPNGTQAHVVCGNVQTSNATVYIIDSVMMPPMK